MFMEIRILPVEFQVQAKNVAIHLPSDQKWYFVKTWFYRSLYL